MQAVEVSHGSVHNSEQPPSETKLDFQYSLYLCNRALPACVIHVEEVLQGSVTMQSNPLPWWSKPLKWNVATDFHYILNASLLFSLHTFTCVFLFWRRSFGSQCQATCVHGEGERCHRWEFGLVTKILWFTGRPECLGDPPAIYLGSWYNKMPYIESDLYVKQCTMYKTFYSQLAFCFPQQTMLTKQISECHHYIKISKTKHSRLVEISNVKNMYNTWSAFQWQHHGTI